MPPVLIIQHVPHEGPYLIGELLTRRGVSIDLRRCDQGAGIPVRPEPGQVVVVMGGPMGVADRHDPRLPFLEREIALLKSCLDAGTPVLGVCLGSQLLAAAAGAMVYANRVREVGFAPIRRERPDDPLFAGLDADPLVLHWHGDTFDLPASAVHLASTPCCRHQAFRLGRAQYGLQFHPEVDAAGIRTWIEADADFVREANGEGGCVDLSADMERCYAEFRAVGERMIGNVVERLLV